MTVASRSLNFPEKTVPSPNNIFSGTGSSSQPAMTSPLRHFLFPQPVPAAPATASTCRSLRFVFDSSDYIKHTKQTGSLGFRRKESVRGADRQSLEMNKPTPRKSSERNWRSRESTVFYL